MRELKTALSTCTDRQKELFTSAIGGKTQMDTLQALLTGLDEEYTDLKQSVTNCDGALQKTAKTMQDNLQGSLTALSSAAEGAGIAFYEKFSEPLRGAVDTITSKISGFTQALSSGELDNALSGLAAGAATVVTALIGMNAVLVVKDISNFASAVKIGTEGLAAYTAATKAGTVAQGALNLVQALSPVGMLAIGVTAVATGLALYAASTIDATSEAEKFAEKQQETIDALEEHKKAREDLAKAAAESLAASDAEINKIDGYIRELDSYTDAQGKVSDAHKTRADYLMNEINNLIPNAVTKLEDEAGAHYNIIESIEDEMVAKRKAALLDAMQDSYNEAIAKRVTLQTTLTSALNDQKTAETELETAMQRVADIQSVLDSSDPNAIGRAIDFEGVRCSYAELETDLVHATIDVVDWRKQLEDASSTLSDAQKEVDATNKTIATFNTATAVESIEELNDVSADYHAQLAEYSQKDVAEVNEATSLMLESYTRRSQEIEAQRESMSDAEKADADTELADFKAHLAEMADTIATGTGKIMRVWIENIQAGQPDVQSAMELVKAGVISAADAQEAMKTVGGFYAQGLAQGIESMTRSPIEAAITMMCNTIQAAEDTAVIASPSKIMIKNGMYFDVGLAKGIKDNSKKAESAAEKMSKAVLSAVNKWLSDQKTLDNATVADEVHFWEQMKEVSELGADELLEVEKKLYKAKQDL